MATLARRRARQIKTLVGFTIADVHYAIDIHRVREIIRPLELIPLPHMPPAVLGVCDHRGAVVPVVDVRTRFGLPMSTASRQRWIVADFGTRLVALVVDAVTDVFGRSDVEERTVPQIGVGDTARGITSVESHGGVLVFVIDIERIAAVAEVLDLSSIYPMGGDKS